jgi:hypothetical protein
VGLVLYAARQRAGGPQTETSVERLFAPVKRWLQDFF